MLYIYLCDSDISRLSFLESIIKSEILFNSYDMKLSASTLSSQYLLEHLSKHPSYINLYILNIHIETEKSGLSLAKEIRRIDPRGFIIFLAEDFSYITFIFSHMLEPISYIINTDFSSIKAQLCKSLNTIHKRFLLTKSPKLSKKYFSISTKSRTLDFDTNHLYYITISSIPHILEICCNNQLTQIRGTINDSIARLPDEFIRISRETIINVNFIKDFNKEDKTLTLTNEAFFQISTRQYRELKKTYNALK